MAAVSTVTEPENMDQLIADCAHVPDDLQVKPAILVPRAAPHWEVDDAAQSHADEMDDYV